MAGQTVSVGIVLYDDERRVLLVKHTKSARLPTGAYGFPAGRLERGETIEEAGIRELEEESGLKTESKYLVRLPERKNTLKMKKGAEDFIFYPFFCSKYWGVLNGSDDNVPEFVSLDDLDKILLVSDDIKEISRNAVFYLGS